MSNRPLWPPDVTFRGATSGGLFQNYKFTIEWLHFEYFLLPPLQLEQSHMNSNEFRSHQSVHKSYKSVHL